MHASFYLMWLTLVCAAESVVSRGESSIRPLTRYWASFAWMSHSCELKPLLIKATIGTWQRLFSRPQHAGSGFNRQPLGRVTVRGEGYVAGGAELR
jgi:hypothetical protein